jgi:hypothetical protein
MSEVNEFKFNRFSEDKQLQIRQLITYMTLLDLSPQDLISIGNKLLRDQNKDIIAKNKALAQPLQRLILIQNFNRFNPRFFYDNKYLIDVQSYSRYTKVTNIDTSQSKTYYLTEYKTGQGIKGIVTLFLLNIVNKDICLDF